MAQNYFINRITAVFFVVFIIFSIVCLSNINIAQEKGKDIFYYVSSAMEYQGSPIKIIHIKELSKEVINGKNYIWWQMSCQKREGKIYGVKILSEKLPMTSISAPGEIIRYIYCDEEGRCFDYRDESTDNAILPILDFVEKFLPHPFVTVQRKDSVCSDSSGKD